MRTLFLLFGLSACRPDEGPDGKKGGVSAEDPGDTAETDPADSGATADTAPLESVGESQHGPRVHFDDELDPSEGMPDPLDGLCQLEMECTAIVGSEDLKVPCNLRVISEDGHVWYDGPMVAWMRGRSTSYVAKRQYGIELRDEADESVEVNLLGMGKESDWVINGNYYDRLLVRNKLGFDLFQGWGGDDRYAPQSALCELTLDGEYRGAYTLVERIKRDGSRIDIEADDGAGGSFVMKQNDLGCFYTNTTTYGCWKLIYPNEDSISEGSSDGITAWLSGWEAAIASADPYDPDAGVYTFADLDSFIDIVLIEEFYKNEDAFYTSMHMWKDQGGPIHFTPWDLDMTFGQFPDYYDYGDPELWIKFRPQLIQVMSGSPEFRERVVARWAELRAGPLDQDAIYAEIDRLQAIYGDAIARNFELWPIETINYGTLFYPVSSYEDEDAKVRAWIAKRLAFMDENIDSYGE